LVSFQNRIRREIERGVFWLASEIENVGTKVSGTNAGFSRASTWDFWAAAIAGSVFHR